MVLLKQWHFYCYLSQPWIDSRPVAASILFVKASIQVLRQESERSKDPSTPLKASTYSHPFVVHQSRDEQIQAARRWVCCNKCVCWSLLGVPTLRIHFWIIYDTLCNVIMSRVWKLHAWNESEHAWELTLYTEVYYVHIWSNTVWSVMRKRKISCCNSFFFLFKSAPFLQHLQ